MKKKKMVELGDKVKDMVSGFTGITVTKLSYLQGCDRFAVQAPVIKNEKPTDWQYFDETQLKVLKKGVVKEGNRVVGGYKPDNAQRP